MNAYGGYFPAQTKRKLVHASTHRCYYCKNNTARDMTDNGCIIDTHQAPQRQNPLVQCEGNYYCRRDIGRIRADLVEYFLSGPGSIALIFSLFWHFRKRLIFSTPSAWICDWEIGRGVVGNAWVVTATASALCNDILWGTLWVQVKKAITTAHWQS